MTFKKLIAVLVAFLFIIIGALYFLGSQADQAFDPSQEIPEEDDENNHDLPGGDVSEEDNEDNEDLEEIALPTVYEGEFDLPISGAAGYASIRMPLLASPGRGANRIKHLEPGAAFMILAEEDNWWQIETSDSIGWIEHKYAFINLPDIMTSIVYDNTNSYSSVFTSSYYSVPEVTGKALYQAIDYNERLEKEEFIMPVLYATAKKLSVAQTNALENGEGLILYETFRPFETQEFIAHAISEMAEENEEVHEGLNREPWTQAWFIITNNVSYHQVGAALDTSLINIETMEEVQIGDYLAPKVTTYTELQMQTPMHELSVDSIIFEEKVPSDSKTAWMEQSLVDEVTEASVRLLYYATQAGFTPIASEWWHFNDLDAIESLGEETGTGEFYLTHTFNRQPSYNLN